MREYNTKKLIMLILRSSVLGASIGGMVSLILVWPRFLFSVWGILIFVVLFVFCIVGSHMSVRDLKS